MEEKISVHENPTQGKKLLSVALATVVGLAAIGSLFSVGPEAFFVLLVLTIPIIYWGFGFIGSKTEATPIIDAGRVVPPIGGLAFSYGAVGAAAGYAIGRSPVVLCKEGVVIKTFIIHMLYPWDRIRAFAASPNTKKVWFNFGFPYYANRPLIQVGENYSEVERILSERIANRIAV